jgi:hypothetical protein
MVARYLIEKKLTIEIDKDAISHPNFIGDSFLRREARRWEGNMIGLISPLIEKLLKYCILKQSNIMRAKLRCLKHLNTN